MFYKNFHKDKDLDFEIEKSDVDIMSTFEHTVANPIEVVMSQAREESLPKDAKSKRNKEKSIDPSKAFVHFGKPFKVVKK